MWNEKDKKIKAFYKEFFREHDNRGLFNWAMIIFILLLAESLWFRTVSFYGAYTLQGTSAQWFSAYHNYSFVILWIYGKGFRYYSVDRKGRSMIDMLQSCPVSKKELKLFWMKKIIIFGILLWLAATIFYSALLYMRYGQVGLNDILLTLRHILIVPLVEVCILLWFKKK